MIPQIKILLLPGLALCFASLATPSSAQTGSDGNIPRRIPPLGLQPAAEQLTRWEVSIRDLETKLESLNPKHSSLKPDIEVLLKACRFAILHQEFYKKTDFGKVDQLLELARTRVDSLSNGKATWTEIEGLQVRGFRSAVDDSAQPIGLVHPTAPSKNQGYPLYVWLHGRGDKTTDLHFIHDRLRRVGQIQPPDAVVMHPFGRQCIGYKSAGETDVLEAIDFVCENYPVDRRRIVLMGFSMGGAGVWHLAAHYEERFVAASPGAGFAETPKYNRLKPEDFPPVYEQMLWKAYDVPGYVHNLFNFPVVAYSGENDKQIQAARVMEEAYASVGRKLPHIIGPGMGHKYHPDSLKEILEHMQEAVIDGQPRNPQRFYIQSPHLRYARRGWLTVDGVDEQYGNTFVEAEIDDPGYWDLRPRNVTRLRVDSTTPRSPQHQVAIDGIPIVIKPKQQNYLVKQKDDSWKLADAVTPFRKRPGVSGPIDDAFIDPFLVVLPSGQSSNPKVEKWMRDELDYLRSRWRSLFRGKLREKLDSEVTDEDKQRFHLVLWGTQESNSLVREALQNQEVRRRLNCNWNASTLDFDGRQHNSANHVLQMIYPNPENPERYVVLNSGPTFRPAHDRTNSLQNPKLPDWVVLSLETPPNAEAAGKVKACGFFNDSWKFSKQLTWE